MPETTYSLEVADFHTYYVSDACVLMYNACSILNRSQNNRTENQADGRDTFKFLG